MTNPTTAATDTTAKPPRQRGVFRLDEEILVRIIDLPEGQRIIGFREDPLRLTIDVCVEGDGLPPCPIGTEPYVVNALPYTARFSRWATRGRDLEEMIEAHAANHCAEDSRGYGYSGEGIAEDLRRILDGSYDPRADGLSGPLRAPGGPVKDADGPGPSAGI